MAKNQTFLRDATGLVREFGILEFFLICCALIFSLEPTVVEFPYYYGFNPGSILPIAIVITVIPFALLMLVYWVVGILMPRAGNDYVWTGRVFHPAVGFAWSAVFLFALLGAGYAAPTVALGYGFSTALYVPGILNHSPGLINDATWLTSRTGSFIVSLLITLLFALVALFGYKSIKRLIYIGWIANGVGIAIMWGLLGFANPTSFAAAWDKVLSQYTTYDNIIQVATNAGYHATPLTIAATIAGIPLAITFLLGGNYANAAAGELKNVKKAIPIGLFLSLLAGVIFWVVTSQLVVNATGNNWLSAIGYLYDNNGGVYSSLMPYPPAMPVFIGVLAYPNQFLLATIAITFLVGGLVTEFFFFWIPTRYFFAWSFDRLIPTKFANVNTRFGTPQNSILIIAAISVVLLALVNYTSYSSVLAMATIIWFAAYILPSLGVAIVPYLRKDIYQTAPGFMKAGNGIVLLLIGLGGTIAFSYATYLALVNPLLASITTVGAIVTFAVLVSAVIIFYASVAYHKREGIDIRMGFKELPPE